MSGSSKGVEAVGDSGRGDGVGVGSALRVEGRPRFRRALSAGISFVQILLKYGCDTSLGNVVVYRLAVRRIFDREFTGRCPVLQVL
jgi:hypothetical protein